MRVLLLTETASWHVMQTWTLLILLSLTSGATLAVRPSERGNAGKPLPAVPCWPTWRRDGRQAAGHHPAPTTTACHAGSVKLPPHPHHQRMPRWQHPAVAPAGITSTGMNYKGELRSSDLKVVSGGTLPVGIIVPNIISMIAITIDDCAP